MISEHQCSLLTFLYQDLRFPNVVKNMEFEMVKFIGFVGTPRLVIDFTEAETASSAVFGVLLIPSSSSESARGSTAT